MAGQEVFNLVDLIKIGLSGGAVVAVLTFSLNLAKDWIMSRSTNKDVATFNALFIIARLDSLAVECANKIWDYNNLVEQARGTEHERTVGSCQRPDLPLTGLALDKIDRQLAARLIWLENEVNRGAGVIMSRWELYLDSAEANDQNTALVGYFGWEALQISDALRSKYSLAYTGPGWGMDATRECLDEQHQLAKNYLKRDV